MKEETPITLDILKVLAQLGLKEEAFISSEDDKLVTLENAQPSQKQ